MSSSFKLNIYFAQESYFWFLIVMNFLKGIDDPKICKAFSIVVIAN